MIEKDDADIAIGNFVEFNNHNGTTLFHIMDDANKLKKVYTAPAWFKNEYSNSFDIDQCFANVWGKLFKKELFATARFPEVKVNEGDFLLWKVYLLASKISYVNDAVYVKRIGVASAVSEQFADVQRYSISAIEERLTILSIIGFDTTAEGQEYRRRLKLHRDHSLDVGDYAGYQDAVYKLAMLKKIWARIIYRGKQWTKSQLSYLSIMLHRI